MSVHSVQTDRAPALARLDAATTALVLVDLQRGVVNHGFEGFSLAPHSAADAVANARRVALALRERGGAVILMRGSMGLGPVPSPAPAADITFPSAGPVDPAVTEVVAELAEFREHVITKYQWGSFYGTDLDLRLRRLGIRTLLVGGVATNLGVEAIAREAHDRGYEQVFLSDAMTAFDGQAHQDSIDRVLRLIGRVRLTDEVLAALDTDR